MATKRRWNFESFEDVWQAWNAGEFTCDDIADFESPMLLDWVARLDDWAPKVALCFNRQTSAVTLDRISQHDMPELRRLVCYHPNVSVETLHRLLDDGDRLTAEASAEGLDRYAKANAWTGQKRRRVTSRR
ncbi:MAG: hypothetical protein KKA42_04430 [candidate division Zixibacteria bacterium]|nr:hypothetical protein [candidate division Zixibacteria bacterium]